MLTSVKVLDALKGIGLNLYERKLWVALLARGTSTAGELSEIANVPRSRAYDVLQSLAEKGFVVVQTAKPIKYIAVAPEEALERAKKKIEENLLRTQERIDEFKSSPAMKELNGLFSQGLKLISPQEMTGALKGKYLVSQQLGTMFKDADHRIDIVTTPEGLKDLYENHLDVLKKAKEKGVDIKIATTGTGKSSDVLKALGGVAEMRVVNDKEVPVSGRIFVVDSKQLAFGLTDSKVHSTQDMVVWSKSEHAAGNMMQPLFKLIWSRSKSVG